MRADWGKMAEEYLAERDELALCIQLIDSRHEPTPLDIQLNDWLVFNNKPHLIVATKADKFSNNELQKSMPRLKGFCRKQRSLTYSAQTGRGREQLWAEINASINKSELFS